MIKTGSIYLIVKNFDEAIKFYKALLERDVTAQNMNRFAVFSMNGLCLSIMNGHFDSENPDKVTTKGKWYEEYDNCAEIAQKHNTGKVVLNLATDNLKNEYDRIRKLGIGRNMTEIRYINAGTPYYYFSMKDPDGNTIEITGAYNEE